MKKSAPEYVKVHTNMKAVKGHIKKIRARGGSVRVKDWGNGDVMLSYKFKNKK